MAGRWSWFDRLGRVLATGIALVASAACGGETVEPVGYNDLRPLTKLPSYPNVFRDVLGKSAEEIDEKIASTFNKLFHGNTNESIYRMVGSDQAYILDVLHDGIRTEGIGYGMMIAVQLGERDVFDNLWRYIEAKRDRQSTGPSRGYYPSECDLPYEDAPVECLDPFGMQQILTALLFARDRWSGDDRADAYTEDARDLLQVMRHKEDQNGGIVDGITNVFDQATGLARDVPNTSFSKPDITRPSVLMPAFYRLWYQATQDPYWLQAADSARNLWKKVAHPKTGLLPLRATFQGEPVSGANTFVPEAYRALIEMVLDCILTDEPDCQWKGEADRLLDFFSSRWREDENGDTTYGTSFGLDGTCFDEERETSLIPVLGATALIASKSDWRSWVIRDAWALDVPTNVTSLARYFTGLLDLIALLILSGQYQVH